MKKTIITGVLAALTIGGAAQAQTVIDLVGSTAARATVNQRIKTVLETSPNTLTSFAYTEAQLGSGVAPTGSNQVIYHGTLNGNAVIIRTFWAGSVNGIDDVVNSVQQTALYNTAVTGNAAGQSVPANNATASAATVPEIGFSDVFQTSTKFSGLTEDVNVAVIPFKWFRNEASASFDNITGGAIRRGYTGNGFLPLSYFTGNTLDTKLVRFTGRNNDSGTRIVANADSGYGAFPAVAQYGNPTLANSNTMISALGAVNNNGQASGGGIARILGATLAPGLTSATAAFVGPVGSSDWAAAVSAGAVELKYNGVTYSDSAVYSGQYTYWSYLHQNRMALSGDTLSFFTQLRDAIIADPGALLKETDMKVSRLGEGAIITPKP